MSPFIESKSIGNFVEREQAFTVGVFKFCT